MASSTFHFPSAEVMTRYLSEHPSLALDYYKEKGITKAVAQLAAARFADSDKVEIGIQTEVALIVYDLQTGEDEYTGAKITKIDGLTPMFWKQFSRKLETILIDCAKKT